MKLKVFYLFLCLFTIGTISVNGQEKVKKEEKKAVIVTKKIEKDGSISEKRIELEGDDIEEQLEELKKSGELEEADIEIIEEKKIRVSSEGHDSVFKMKAGEGTEQNMEITIDKDGEGEGKIVMKIIDPETGEEKVMEWKMQDGMDMKFGDMDGPELRIFKEDEMLDDDLPEVKVRLGIRLDDRNGLKIVEIEEGSALQNSELQEGDIITEIDGYYVGTYRALLGRLATYNPGDEVSIRYAREGKATETKVKLAAKD